MKDIIIAGAGWYGLHIAYKYQNKHNITILEKNPEIFMESSFNNQNRLHLGFHYPRSYKTRKLCKNGYDLFLNDYNEIVDKIDKNYYCISNESLLDFETYIHIFQQEGYNFDVIKNDIGIKNIHGELIKVDEMLINHKKAKQFFINNLKNVNIMYNFNVEHVYQDDNFVYINNNIKCDLFLDCTYGKLNLNNSVNNYIYEVTISFVYEKIKEYDADCITIMDGKLPSLFIREKEKNLYSLTHVKYTPIFTSNNKNDILHYIPLKEEIEICKLHMELEIKKYISKFNDIFKYNSYYLGYKLKKNDNSDDRTCNIYKNGNIISVNGGKITGIYDFEKYINSIINL
jgi:hypothetical protein